MKTAIFCSNKIDGGGEQSASQIAKLLDADLVSLVGNEWKNADHEKQIWYMNDSVYSLCDPKKKIDFVSVLSKANEIYIVLNFVLGGIQRADWLRFYPIKKILFLNETKRNEWLQKCDHSLKKIPTVSLAPCVDISQYLTIKRKQSDKIRIGRHSRISLKYPSEPCKVYDMLLNLKISNRLEFRFMLAHKKIVAEYGNHPQFKFYQWNQQSVAEFLSETDIFLYLIAEKVKDQGPRVIVEAMAAGVPCVTENRDGMKDRIKNFDSGILVNNTEQTVNAVKILATNKDHRERIGNNARSFASDNFRPENWINQLNNEITNVTAGENRGN